MPADDLREQLKPKAREFLTSLHSSPLVLKREAWALGAEALLLRFSSLWKTAPKPDPRRILRDLVDFSIFELGALPLLELTLIWSGITAKPVAPFFGPLISPSDKTLKAARGMAWDMTHLRALQDAARQTVLGSFFIPYFASLDARWRALLRLNPIRVMLVDDAKRSANFSRARDVEFQILLGEVMSPRATAERAPAKVQARRLAAKNLEREAMAQLAKREREAWKASTQVQ
ncbi:hypothetical protein [Roseateles saccharophilus]|nr:hypothetical protein [Roseateles saccharophilus]MDG0836153.1 hypothetical protein [Roseateles saccharophilus]